MKFIVLMFSLCSANSDLRFHHIHGKNAKILNNGLTALRPRALGEFNEAIVIANRALRDGEMFEVTIDKMVDRWTGAIEAGKHFYVKVMIMFFEYVTFIDSFVRSTIPPGAVSFLLGTLRCLLYGLVRLRLKDGLLFVFQSLILQIFAL